MDLLPRSRPMLKSNDLHKWLFEKIRPYLKGRVLEMDSSLNSISTLFVQEERPIHLSTSDKELRKVLLAHYKSVESIQKVHSINFHRRDFEQAYPTVKARVFDTVLILNAMQNGIYDTLVVQNAKHLLRERGRLILLAPASIAVYNGCELDFQELTMFNRLVLHNLLAEGLKILMTHYFDLAKELSIEWDGISVIIVARKR